MHATWLRSGLLGAGALLGLLAACASSGLDLPSAAREMSASAPPAAERPLRVFVSGDTRGQLEPCGCGTDQYGGFPRRGAYLAAVARAGDLRIEIGNAAAGSEPIQRMRLGWTLEALRRLGYDVFVPGENEVRLGEDFERAAAELERPAVVSANLRRADGSRVFAPWRVHTLPDGRRVAVVGLTESVVQPPERYAIDPPAQALTAALEELAGQADAVVVAATLPEGPELAEVAAVPGVSLVVSGKGGIGSEALRHGFGAPLLLVGERGAYVGRVDFDPALRPVAGWQAWLDEDVPDDAGLKALVADYREAVGAFSYEYLAGLRERLRDSGYVGSETCAQCHAEEFAAWQASGHSHAMHTLEEKQAERDPDCIRCHLQDVRVAAPGAGEGGAADGPAADAAHGTWGGIGCEGCHGGGSAHVELVSRQQGGVPVRVMPRNAIDTCVRCHTPDNSPQFDLAPYWDRIRH